MAKSHIKTPDGTDITIEGSELEVAKILQLFATSAPRKESTRAAKKASVENDADESDAALQIVNKVKDCEEADNIETNILDKTSAVNRVLLPLYISHEYFENKIHLQTGEISKILSELGTPISGANVAHCIAGPAKSYVMGDRLKKKGQTVKYRISRKGLSYLKEVINGK